MTTAIKLREIDNGRQAEYQINPPITVTESGMSMEVTYLISSHSTLTGMVGHETMFFPSDGDGNIISYMDLYYMPGHVDHDVAVQNFLKENTHEQTSHNPQQPCTHLGTQKPGEQEMSTEPKVYTAVEVASAGPGQKEIDQTLAEVTQEAYEAAKKGKTRVVYYNANDNILTKIAQQLRELGYTTELFEQVVNDSYIIVRWGNTNPTKENNK